MENLTFTNVIVGFGKAGKTLAKFLAGKGESVALIEKSKSMCGGTCINIACIPSKSLIVNGEKGQSFDTAMQTKNTLIAALNQKNYHMVADEATATVLDGQAHFLSDHELELLVEGEVAAHITGERIFINTGASPIIPDIEGLAGNENLLTSTEALSLQAKPEKLAIIGSGFIGLEFAGMYAAFGSQVTVIDPRADFAPTLDIDVAAQVKADLEGQGISFKLGVTIKSVRANSVELDGESVAFDKVLVATGRKPNTTGLGLENTSVKIGERGEIVVNDKLESSAPKVWALGDVHGGAQFTFTSLDDFRIVKSQLYGNGERTLSNRGIYPTSIFITPTLSQVGMTEKEAQAKNQAYRLFTLPAANIPKAAIMGDKRGLLKALVDPETDKILGVTLYVVESHELINEIALVMKAGLPYSVLRDNVYNHPTISEGLNDLFADGSERAV